MILFVLLLSYSRYGACVSVVTPCINNILNIYVAADTIEMAQAWVDAIKSVVAVNET